MGIYPMIGIVSSNEQISTGSDGNYLWWDIGDTQANTPIHVINFKAVEDAMDKAAGYIATMKNDPGAYSTSSIQNLAALCTRLNNLNPNNWQSNFAAGLDSAVASWAAEAKSVCTAVNNFKLEYRTYTVTFDNLIDMASWNTSSASNATISNVTNNGFTLTSNSGVGEGTSTSHYFPVEPGKSYRIDIDVEGSAWDVYIFFCDANGSWIDFVDGQSNRYSNNTTWDSVFTAPNKDSVVKAQIRVDANGASNTVKFSNIRVYDEGMVEDGVSYETVKTVTFASGYGTLPTPTRPGYSFTGWVDKDGNAVTANTVANDASPKALYSKWSPVTYTITYELDGGTITSQDYTTNTYTIEDNLVLPSASKTGYTFDGWKITQADGSLGTVVNQVFGANNYGKGLYGNATMTAQWSVNSFTVTFEDEDGTVIDTQTVDYGKGATAPADPSKAYDETNHYTFSGWDTAFSNITADTTVKATYSATPHSYTYTDKDDNTHTAACSCGYSKEEGHNYDNGVINPAPDCNNAGVKTFTCSDCGGTKTETVTATGHNMVAGEVVAPTCTTDGYTVYTCANGCGTTENRDIVTALGHTWTDATCTAPKTCSVCGATEGEALGHDFSVLVSSTAGDCQTVGTTTYKCSCCDVTNVVNGDYGAHSYKSEVTAPTCTEDGYTTYTCSICNDTYKDDEVTALGHTPGTAVKENEKEATCTAEGSYNEVVYCSVCNEKLSSNTVTVPKKDHQWSAWAQYQNGDKHRRTCSVCSAYEEGSHTFNSDVKPKADSTSFHDYKCDLCDARGAKFNGVDKLNASESCFVAGVTYSDNGDGNHTATCICGRTKTEAHWWSVTDSKDATCTEEGYKNSKCDYCPATKEETIPATHTLGEWVEEVSATCVKEGTKGHYTCSECGKHFDAEGNEISDLTIAINDNHVNIENKAKQEPTCTEVGYEAGVYCNDCQTWISGHEEIEAKGHSEAEAVKEKIIKASCVADGSYEDVVYCSVCSTELSREAKVITKREHKFTDWVEIKEPTYTEKGEEKHTCTNAEDELYEACSYEETREVDMLVDNTAPTGTITYETTVWDKFLETITFGIYVSDDVQLTITAEDAESGIAKIEYYISDVAMAEDDVKAIDTWSEYTDSVTIAKAAAAQKVVYAKLTNTQGATKYLSTDGFTFDTVDPVISTESDCTTAIITVTEINLDKVTVNDTEIALDENGTYTISGVGTYKVVATDKAGNTAEISVEIKGHTPAEAVRENEVAATCYKEGSYDEVVYCSVEECKAQLSREEKTIEKIAHTPAEAVREKEVAATCYKEGSYDEVVYCSVEECKEKLSSTPKTIEKIAHTPGAAVEENLKEATCYAEGSYDEVVYCSVCDAELSSTPKTIEKIAHTPAEAVRENEVKATCYKEGSYDEVVCCSVAECKAQLSREEKTIEKIAHTPAEAVREKEVAATCYKEGSYDEVVYCSVAECKHEISRIPKTIEKIAHTPGAAVEENREEATCTVDGSYESVVYCSVAECKAQISRDTIVLPAPGHSYTSEVTAPTCETDGFTTHTCSACGHSYVTDTVTALDHAYDETRTEDKLTRPTQNANGTWTNGYYTFVCANDNTHTKTVDVERADYTDYETAVKNLNELLATDITEEAKKAINDALADNKLAENLIESEQQTVNNATAALTEVFNNYKGSLNTYTVTFIVDGKTVKTETVISGKDAVAPTVVEKTSDAENHYTFTTWDNAYTNVTEDITVTAQFSSEAHTFSTHADKDDEYHTDKCSCGYKKDVQHSYDGGVVTTPATCEGKGVKTYTCSVCGGTKTEEIKELGHKYESKITAPTCTEQGYTTYTCKVCGSAYDSDFVNKLGHSFTKYVSDGNSTCIADGTKTAKCDRCDVTDTIKGEKDANNHVGGTYTEDENVVLGTCISEKTWNEVTYCSDCNAKLNTEAKTGDKDANNHVGETYTKDEDVVLGTCISEKTWNEVTYCSDCNAKLNTEAKTGDKDANNHAGETYTQDEDVVLGTCISEKTWNEVTYCSDCNTKLGSVAKTGDKDANNHVALAQVTAKAPTCTEDGYKAYEYCSECDYTTYEVDPATGHTEEAIPAVDATCEDTGLTAGVKCSVCGEILTAQEEVPALGHKWDAATCTAPKTCLVCGKTEGTVGGHTIVTQASKAPTCEEDGFSEGSYCSVCGEIFSAQIEFPATGHIKATRKENIDPATCQKEGYYDLVTYCETCGKVLSTEGKTIGKTEHAAGSEEIIEEVKATCKADGYRIGVTSCSVCDEEISRRTIVLPKLKHSPTETPAVKPTCETTGLTEGTHCEICGTVLTAQKVIPATGHTKETITATIEAATCTKEGVSEITVFCTVCDKTLSVERKPIPMAEHTPADEIREDETPATCGKNGKYTSVINCSVCGAEISRRVVVIPSSGEHDFTIDKGRVEPTCTENGYIAYACTCGAQQKTVLYATGHIDKNGDLVCDDCGAKFDNDCGCLCHKDHWFIRFIYKIVRFFWKLFRIHKECYCTSVHY